MAVYDDLAAWQFARLACPLTDCAGQLALLNKKLKARTKKASDPLFGYSCRKLDHDSSVYFHRIDSDRAVQGMVQALHRFPAEESPSLRECCQAGIRDGYYHFVQWKSDSIDGEWNKYEYEGRPARVAWEQSKKSAPAPAVWKKLWHSAAQQLEMTELLGERDLEGLAIPEVPSRVPHRVVDSGIVKSQIVDNFRGGMAIVSLQSGPGVRLQLYDTDTASARAVWNSGRAETAAHLGAPSLQILNIDYRGANVETSQRINAALPLVHSVDYSLHDNETDKYYRDMLKPLALHAGQVRAFPAIEVALDPIGFSPTLTVNVVRTSDHCWLEFQAIRSFELLPWIGNALKTDLDAWIGAPEGRWGW